jgi:hypothetical protein
MGKHLRGPCCERLLVAKPVIHGDYEILATLSLKYGRGDEPRCAGAGWWHAERAMDRVGRYRANE